MLGNLFNTRHEIWKGSHWKLARGRVPNVGLSCNRNVPRHFRMTYEQKFFGGAHVEYDWFSRLCLPLRIGFPCRKELGSPVSQQVDAALQTTHLLYFQISME